MQKSFDEKISRNFRPVYLTAINREDAGEWWHGYL